MKTVEHLPHLFVFEGCTYGHEYLWDYCHLHFSQKSMIFYVFREQICEMYVDDLLVYGQDDDDFVANVRTIFQKCGEKTVTLGAKKTLYLGFDTVPFVGHELDSTDINMSQKRIQSTIQFLNQIPLRNYTHSWA